MNIIAFDLSLTCIGFAGPDGSGAFVPPASASRGVDRLRWIRDEVLRRSQSADLVVIEGYSFASKGNAIISLGELGGAVRCAFADVGRAYAVVSPAARAMFATGKGNAGKPEVLAAAIRELDYQGHSYDEADALWLYRMARAHYARNGDRLNEKRRQAIAKVEWPELPVPA